MVRKAFVYFGILLAFLAMPMASAAIQQISHIGNGNSFDIVENNGYLYAAQGTEIRIYDVSSESKISALNWKSYVSKIDAAKSLIRAIYLDSNYLYIAGEKDFSILDVSNPLSPKVLSGMANPSSTAEFHDVEVSGNYAYLANTNAGILVINILNKASPQVVTTLPLPGNNSPWRIAISGNYLYSANGNTAKTVEGRLDIVDISNPLNPSVAGNYSPAGITNNSLTGVVIKGNYAYVTEYHDGVYVVDVSNPAAPFNVTSIIDRSGGTFNANDVKIVGNYAYVSVRYQGFNIINITNPASISILKKVVGNVSYAEGIYPTPSHTYIADESRGFVIYNTADILSPVFMVNVIVIGGHNVVALKDNFMFIGAHNDGVWSVDISDPASPRESSFVPYIGTSGRVEEMGLQDNYLYVAADWAGLNILDITDLANPKIVVSSYGPSMDNLLVDGAYLYAGWYNPERAVGVLDITDPKNPKEISKTLFNITYRSKFAKYGSKYLLDATLAGDLGLHIIDVENKLLPAVVKTYDAGVAYSDVAVNGDIAVALTGNSIETINIADVNNPVLLDKETYQGTWTPYAIDIYDNVAYVAGGSRTGGLKAFNISNPANITLIGTFDLSQESKKDIKFYKGKLYVADSKYGSYILTSLYVPTSPMPDPTLSLSDPATGRKTHTSSSTVNVAIGNDATAAAWILSETQATPPLASDSRWTSSKPATYTFANVEGFKSLYVWVKDSAGNVNTWPVKASIILDTTPPAFASSEPLDGTVTSSLNSIKFTFSDNFNFDETGTSISVTKNGAPFTAYSRNNFVDDEITLTVNSPSDGKYAFTITPEDMAGNSAPQRTINAEDLGVSVMVDSNASIDDAYLVEKQPSQNFGNYPYIRIGRDPDSTKRRGVVKFDLSSIPAGATIAGASLTFDVFEVVSPVTLNVHELLNSWKELEVGWSKRNSTTTWATPGGDFGPVLEAKSFSNDSIVVFNGPAILNSVRKWVNGTSSNNGFLVEYDAAATGTSYTLRQVENTANRPTKLEVIYVLPDSAYVNATAYFYPNGTVIYGGSLVGKTQADIKALPSFDRVSVFVNKANSSFANFTADATGSNYVAFTVGSLNAGKTYRIRKDGADFTSALADSFGTISFNNSVW